MIEPYVWVMLSGAFILGVICIITMFLPDKRLRQHDRRFKKFMKELERKSKL